MCAASPRSSPHAPIDEAPVDRERIDSAHCAGQDGPRCVRSSGRPAGPPLDGCDRERERLFDGSRRHGRARPCPFVRVLTGACSRAEAKGEGAPTGMSTTVAVAGRPIHTRPAYAAGVPKAFQRRSRRPHFTERRCKGILGAAAGQPARVCLPRALPEHQDGPRRPPSGDRDWREGRSARAQPWAASGPGQLA